MDQVNSEISPKLQMLINNKEDGWNYRERRHSDWDENYELYRDKVQINRLAQRQSVNIPLMKQQIRSLLKDVDDMPVLYFENLDNDKDAEIFKNEYWKYTVEINNMEIQDLVDKRQVFLFGRSFDQWQIVDGKIKMTVQDPMDILVSRFCDPFNLNSSRFLIHTHIFVPLSVLENDSTYDQVEVLKLKEFYATQQGLIKLKENHDALVEKNKKLSDMGVSDIDDPILGETYVELSLHFTYRENELTGKKDEEGNDTYFEEQLFLSVEADNMAILMEKPLEEVIGETEDHYWRNHYPYSSWADDLERQDFWSDAIADMIRTPNKVVNSWFSQEVERRTLSNLGMHYYNSNLEGFAPQTFEPVGWGWYPIPLGQGQKLDDVMKKVEIPANDGNLESINFLIGITEKASGATATQQGAQTQRQVTLGEVQLALGEAKERIKGMSKFYTPAWKQRGEIFIKLVEAGHSKLDAVKRYKKGNNSNKVYARDITPKDWMTPSGYACKVWSQDDKQALDTDSLNKLNAVRANMPDNPKVTEIYQRKLLEFAGLQPDEVNEIMQFEQQKIEANANMLASGGMPQLPGQAASPVQPQPGTQPLQIPPQV